ncbi:MAG: hypothetical protein C3F07_07950 [Anaerolineales bacterium]|nr:hypothetical protein [Anaerolineae bacterium]PWB74330.1 MAG: hypothetical protein C3F07_07950 [Anaerolineales bacterium]
MRTLIGVFLLLHGLVHMWYVTLSQGWVEYQADMGWTGKSWLLTNLLGDGATHTLATVFYSLSTLIFLVASAGLIAIQTWNRPWLLAASIVSSVTILVLWDGHFDLLVQKGLLGLLINVGILVTIYFLK